jgi:RND superfamily putative drug exporter
VRAVAPPRALNASTWQLDVLATGDPEGAAARELVHEIRTTATPYRVLVGGAAAEFVDQQDAIGSNLALGIGLLVALTMLVLWLMTGSLVLPVKAIVMNALTVGSSLGIATLVFQDGRFEDLLGYTANGGVEPTDFLVAAALVFALSTDYGVFLLGRIKEARDAGRTDREAVAVGVERTSAVVTAAAILLAVAIGAFITSSISFIQQIGIATAAGVLIDAFIVRTLLVPSLMALLGRWNWWSPRPLTYLHARIGLREATT